MRVKKQHCIKSDLIIYQDFTVSKKYAMVKTKQKAAMYKAKHQSELPT